MTCGGATAPGTATVVFRRPAEPPGARTGHRAEFRFHQQRRRRTRRRRAARGGRGGRLRRRPPAHPAARRPRQRPADRHRHRRDPGPRRALRPVAHRTRPHRTACWPSTATTSSASSPMSATGIADVLREAGVDPERLLGVGIGVPGIVEHDASGAAARSCTARPSAGAPSRSRSCSATPSNCPRTSRCFIDNGAKTLGQAEMWFGGGRGAREAAVALIGSGVGACVVTPAPPTRTPAAAPLEWGQRPCGSGAGAAAAAPSAAWRRTRARRRCASAGSEAGGPLPADADDETALAALLAAAYPARTAPSPTRWRSPSWTRPPSTWARPSPT